MLTVLVPAPASLSSSADQCDTGDLLVAIKPGEPASGAADADAKPLAGASA